MRKSRMNNLNAEAALRSDGKGGFARNVVDRFSLEKLLEASDLKDKMAQAGLARPKADLCILYGAANLAPCSRRFRISLSHRFKFDGLGFYSTGSGHNSACSSWILLACHIY